jgi:hypothetical protein
MDIGTGKVPRDNKKIIMSNISKRKLYFYQGIRHHLIESVLQKIFYGVNTKISPKCIKGILKRNKTPYYLRRYGFLY